MKTLMICVVMVMAGCGRELTPAAVAPPAVKDIALAFAKDRVTASLLAPSTASYPIETVTVHSFTPFVDRTGVKTERWVVSGGVDAHNIYGAMIRSQWEVVCLAHGESFKPVQAFLNDKEVYIDSLFAKELAAIQAAEDAASEARAAAIREELKQEREATRLAQIEEFKNLVVGWNAELKQHEAALKELPERPAGGKEFTEVENHRKAVGLLRFKITMAQREIERLASK